MGRVWWAHVWESRPMEKGRRYCVCSLECAELIVEFYCCILPVKDESGALLLVIHPSTFCKIRAIPNEEIFWISKTLGCPGINSTPFMKSLLNIPSVPMTTRTTLVFTFHVHLQILVRDNFFSFFKCDVFITGTETSISIQDLDFLSWTTMSSLLAKIFLSVIIA